MVKASRLATAWLMGVVAVLLARHARAGVESHVLGDDLRIVVDRAGGAMVEETISLRVQGGWLRSLDLAIASAGIEPMRGSVSSTDPDRALPITDGRVGLAITPAGLHLAVEAASGLSKGTYAFRLGYRKDLRRAGQVRADGALARIEWTGARWDDGFDNARCTFVVPSGPSAPLVTGEARVTRGAGADEIELLRPHVARGETVTWSLRADLRAFDDATPPPRRLSAMAVPSPSGHARELALLGVIMLGFSALVGAKAKRARADALGKAVAKPLVPLPTPARVLLAGPALAAGAALQFWLESPWWGTCLVAAAMATGAYRLPAWLPRPRGPGQWLALSDAEAFAAPRKRRSWLDASTPAGKACLFVSLLGCAGIAYAVSRTSIYAAYLVVIDSAVLLPIFGTGLCRDLPPDPVLGLGPALGRMARELRKSSALRVVAWGRVALGSDQFDEVRLLCVPRRALKGLGGIEIGLLPANGAGGRVDWPEILVRTVDASPCHRALASLLPRRPWTPGRRAHERVTWLRPALPTSAMTVALARRLVAGVQPDARVVPPSSGKAEARSAGSGDRTSNASTSASPFQAM